ncbi:hypothetical protein F2P56_007541 [Juglans regia]|uniref:Uncharacterized protein n=1 Tax=Juglans regia TaxID=51240 RepID=A0A833Y1P1_JUGRE|nr:hypothetical protein F2P56_007541 [Juglans regia]
MNTKGSVFIWCNGHSGLACSWAILDRALLDSSLMSSFPNVVCSHLPRSTLDHSPLLIEFNFNPFSYGLAPFQFQQVWVDRPEFLDCVQNVWSELVTGMGLFIAKLKKTKVVLREWNRVVFGRTNVKIDLLENQIEEVENRLRMGWDEEVNRELIRSSA